MILVSDFLKENPNHMVAVLEASETQCFFLNHYATLPELEAIIPLLSITYLKKIFTASNPIQLEYLVNKINPYTLGAIVKTLSGKLKKRVVELIPNKHINIMNEALSYHDQQLGYYIKSADLVLSLSTPINLVFEEIDKLNFLIEQIIVVDSEYRFYGVVDLISLIKSRKLKNSNLKHAVKKKVMTLKASLPVKEVTLNPAWLSENAIPVVGKSNLFLGVVSKKLLADKIKPYFVKSSQHDIFEEYLFFSEYIWKKIHQNWLGIK